MAEVTHTHPNKKRKVAKEAAHNERLAQAAVAQGNVPAKLDGSQINKQAQHSKHVRFGSEDPPAPADVYATADQTLEQYNDPSEDEQDSDDDAPETVTTSTATEQLRAAQAEQRSLLEREKAAAKRKRRERDARLRDQAQSSKKTKRRKAEDSDGDEVDEEDAIPFQPSDASSTIVQDPIGKANAEQSSLPTLLPESLLSQIDAIRPVSPPPLPVAAPSSQPHRRITKFEEKAPKDVKRSGINVRVLPQSNRFLPAKVDKATSNIRNQWLQKDAKKAKGMRLERKAATKGFVR